MSIFEIFRFYENHPERNQPADWPASAKYSPHKCIFVNKFLITFYNQVICSTCDEKNNMNTWDRARSHWLTTTVFFEEQRGRKKSFPVSFTLDSTICRGRKGRWEGVGDVRGQSKCVTATTMMTMTHLVPFEAEACEAWNWHSSHTRRIPTSRWRLSERVDSITKKLCVTEHRCILKKTFKKTFNCLVILFGCREGFSRSSMIQKHVT